MMLNDKGACCLIQKQYKLFASELAFFSDNHLSILSFTFSGCFKPVMSKFT